MGSGLGAIGVCTVPVEILGHPHRKRPVFLVKPATPVFIHETTHPQDQLTPPKPYNDSLNAEE